MRYLLILVMFFTAVPAMAAGKPLKTEQDCKAIGPGYEDYQWCYMDLAEQQKDIGYCNVFETWRGTQECIYYVDRARKISADECRAMVLFKNQCTEYVSAGIPSKPGVSYEESLGG